MKTERSCGEWEKWGEVGSVHGEEGGNHESNRKEGNVR